MSKKEKEINKKWRPPKKHDENKNEADHIIMYGDHHTKMGFVLYFP